MDFVGHPAGQAGVRLHENLHLVRIAGHDDHHFVPVILHFSDEGIDGLLAVVPAVVVAGVEGIGFVDEKDGSVGAAADFAGFGGGFAHVAAAEAAAGDLVEVADFEDPLLLEDPADDPGNGGFAGARAAHEAHVQAGPFREAAAFGQLLLGLHLGHHFENAIPDMLHAHHFVELGDTRFRGRLPGEAVEIGGSDAGIVRLGGGVG